MDPRVHRADAPDGAPAQRRVVGSLEPRQHHDSADHDPERQWAQGHDLRLHDLRREVIVVRAEEAPLDRGESLTLRAPGQPQKRRTTS